MSGLRHLLLISLLGAACSNGATEGDAGQDATRPGRDAGPPRALPFAEIGATTEGIALGRTPDGSSVLYVGARDDRIVRIAPDGTAQTLTAIPGPVGIAVRADGELVVCAKTEAGAAGLFAVTPGGAISPLVTADPDGAPFGLTNFVAVAPDDSLVFSDSMNDRVYRADPDGGGLALVTDAIAFPNGMAFSPDGGTLYVASWSGGTIHALAFDRASSTYGPPSPALRDVLNVDGVVATTSGRLVLVTSSSGVLVADPGSTETEALTLPRDIVLPANGVFGDEAFGSTDIFVSALADTRVFRVPTTWTGVALPAR